MSSKKFENSILIIIGIIVGKGWLYLLRSFEFSNLLKILLLAVLTIILHTIFRIKLMPLKSK